MISLQRFINSKIHRVFLYLVITSILAETSFGLYFLTEGRKAERNKLFSEFKSVLKDPIEQGSHIEAYARLARYIGKDGIKCISLEIDKNVPMGKCTATEEPFMIKLAKNDFLSSSEVRINIWIDDSDLWRTQIWLFLSRTTYYLFALVALSFLLRKNILQINHEILEVKNRFKEDFKFPPESQLSILEFQDLSETLENLSRKIKESEKQKAVLEIAKKVSHDIRSPLSALNMISSRVSGLLPEEGTLLKSATSQILRIAEDLLDQNRSFSITSHSEVITSTIRKDRESISDLKNAKNLADDCHENFLLKELEFKNDNQRRLSFSSSVSSENLVHANSHQLQRVISNIVNNAMESLTDKGFVSLNLEENDSCFIIEIRDSGKGMSIDVIEKVKKGHTEGKLKGNGFGLHNSIKTIESWGGTLSIHSTPFVGTTISIRLNLSAKEIRHP